MRKFNGGEPFAVNHKDHNRWQDAGRYISERGSGTGGSLEMPDEQTGVILVKNTLSRDLPQYSVLGLMGSVYDPLNTPRGLQDFQNQIALKGESPDPDITGRFCVLQTAAKAGEVVPAMVMGVTPVRLSITSVDDEFAEIETDSEVSDKTRYLKSGSTGSAQILFQPEVEGEQWGVVRIGNRVSSRWYNDVFTGLNNGIFTAGSSGSSEYSGFNNLTSSGDFFSLDGDGYLVIEKAQTNPQIFGLLYVSVPFEQNNWTRVECNLQQYSGGVWSDIGQNVYRMTAWPNVAILSSTGAVDSYTMTLWSVYGATAISVATESKIRLEIKTYYSGTAPFITVDGAFNAIHL